MSSMLQIPRAGQERGRCRAVREAAACVLAGENLCMAGKWAGGGGSLREAVMHRSEVQASENVERCIRGERQCAGGLN